MPNICFHALVPDAEVAELTQRVRRYAHALVDAADIAVNCELSSCAEEPQLRQTYRDQHEDTDLAGAHVYAFDITLVEPQRSLNETAMMFARLFTPPAELRLEEALLKPEETFEIPAQYPWLVRVYP